MALTLVIASAAMLALHSQGAAITGAVVDATSGEALGGAVVMLSDIDRAVATNLSGRYRFENVPAGPQHLAVRYIGYAPRTIHALVPAEGELEITIALTAVPTSLATVEVRPPMVVRGSEPRFLDDPADRSMSIAAVRNHPLLAEPDVLEAIGGGEVATAPEAPSGVHLRGAAADQTAYLLDGFPVLSPYHAAGLFGAFNPDALAEVEVWTSSMPPDAEATLGGTVSVTTRRPGGRTRVDGSASATQVRVTADGALGFDRGGYLVSARRGFPGLLASARDASHLKGNSEDRIGTVEAPLAGGMLRALYYDGANELSAAARGESDGSALRNGFEWESRTLGAQWHRVSNAFTVDGRIWSASGTTEALWFPQSAAPSLLESSRDDAGAFLSLERGTSRTTTMAALRLQRSRTSLSLDRRASTGDSLTRADRVAVTHRIATLFLRHRRRLVDGVSLQADAAVARLGDRSFVSPGMMLRWSPREWVAVIGAYSRRHQFAQSLRNDESLIGTIFPADVFIGAGPPGVPVARGDVFALGARIRPGGAFSLTGQAYERRSRGLMLAAAGTSQPFALDEFETGVGASRGVSVEATMSGRRYAALASSAWQRTRVRHEAGTYTPHYAAAHRIDAGLVVFPATTLALRLGATAITGRTSTPSHGALEWESCNLLDLGCEFGGSPVTRPAEAGARTLPAYVRLDVGVRKHWHIKAGRRDVYVALFATVTNILSRPNTLAYAIDDATGESQPIDMRPLAPLVVGLDWRF